MEMILNKTKLNIIKGDGLIMKEAVNKNDDWNLNGYEEWIKDSNLYEYKKAFEDSKLKLYKEK